MFTVLRRNDTVAEHLAVTEFRRLPHLSAARRTAHAVAYRFFEGLGLLASPRAQEVIGSILTWDGREPINVAAGGHRLVVAAQ